MKEILKELYSRRHSLSDADKRKVVELINEGSYDISLNTECPNYYADAIIQMAIAEGVQVTAEGVTASGNYYFDSKIELRVMPDNIILNRDTPDEVIESYMKRNLSNCAYRRIEKGVKDGD